MFAGGLHDQSATTVIDPRGGSAEITDGPYLESKEYLGGFWVIEVPDLDAALALVPRRRHGLPRAPRGPAVHGRAAAGRLIALPVVIEDVYRREWDSARGLAGPPLSALTLPRRRPARRSSRPSSTGGRPPAEPWWLADDHRHQDSAIDRIRRESQRDREVRGGRCVISTAQVTQDPTADELLEEHDADRPARRSPAADLHLLPSGASPDARKWR